MLLGEDIVPEIGGKPLPLRQDADGLWSVTVGPLADGIYDYAFTVDGVKTADPVNGLAKTGAFSPITRVVVGDGPWLPQPVPQGQVHVHGYHSALDGVFRECHVYTPPGYDAAKPGGYPVLYLLHGRGERAGDWWRQGRAHHIASALIAAKQVAPLMLVMPEGHLFDEPDYSDPQLFRNMDGMPDALFSDVIPLVEANYACAAAPAGRALAGLSMGAGSTQLTIGMRPGEFGAAGLFSFGFDPRAPWPLTTLSDDIAPFEALDRFMIATGDRDDLTGAMTTAAHDFFTARGVAHEWVVLPGGHSWPVWMRLLAEHWLPGLWPA